MVTRVTQPGVAGGVLGSFERVHTHILTRPPCQPPFFLHALPAIMDGVSLGPAPAQRGTAVFDTVVVMSHPTIFSAQASAPGTFVGTALCQTPLPYISLPATSRYQREHQWFPASTLAAGGCAQWRRY